MAAASKLVRRYLGSRRNLVHAVPLIAEYRQLIGLIKMLVTARTALLLALAIPAFASAQEPTGEAIELPSDVVEGFYVTLDDVRAKSEEVYDALAGAAGDPISRNDFVGRRLPDQVVPQQTDRELLQRLFTLLDADGDGKLTRAEWNERITSDLSSADADDDGKITLRELSRARENLSIGDALEIIF